MARRPAGWVLIGSFLLLSGACASTRMSTRDIFAELAFSVGIVCTPNAVARLEQRQDERLNQRLRALGPWLVAEIGRDEINRMQHDYDEEIGTFDPIGCPPEEEHARQRMRRMMLLHELENRARARHFRPVAAPGDG
jgi:hypothetical protein